MKKTITVIVIVAALGGIGYWYFNRKKTAAGTAGTGSASNSTIDAIKDMLAPASEKPATLNTDAPAEPGFKDLQTGLQPTLNQTLPQNPADMTQPENFRGAIFYDHPYWGEGPAAGGPNKDIGGYAAKLPIGLYPSHISLEKMGLGNDSISSVRLDPGIGVKLYTDANFKGESITVTKDNPGPPADPSKVWKNKISSIEVFETGGYSFNGMKVR